MKEKITRKAELTKAYLQYQRVLKEVQYEQKVHLNVSELTADKYCVAKKELNRELALQGWTTF